LQLPVLLQGRRILIQILCRRVRRGFAADGELDCDVPPPDDFFVVAGLPTVTYLRIFCMRFGPMPLIARKSSTLLNGPYDLRIFRILSAVGGPIPGPCCSPSAVAGIQVDGSQRRLFVGGKPLRIARNGRSSWQFR
jgi:hypothetical protein